MAKFTDNNDPVRLPVSLSDYLTRINPDILRPMAIMNGKNPLTFFQELFEPPRENEKKVETENGINWPYAKRLTFLANKFRILNNEAQQEIISARKYKIFWRGEEPEKFSMIIDETLYYRELAPELKEDYRKKAMSMALTFMERNG